MHSNLRIIFIGIALFLSCIFPGFAEEHNADEPKLEKATFAGGCFWCMVHPFDKLKGVRKVISGYTGGSKENPTYNEVSSGMTGHCEAIEISYDPAQITYEKLLDHFWHNTDPTTPDKQFVDVGEQYCTAIFYHSDEQKQLAESSKIELDRSGVFKKLIVTKIVPAGPFYPAEDYHQDYYKKNPFQYNLYRAGSGRDQYLDKVWGKDREK